MPRFDLMAQLERARDGMALGELSNRMMVSLGNSTLLVERLAESGHISRTKSLTDRRVEIIALTPFGCAKFEKIAAAQAEWIGDLFGTLPVKDGAILLEELVKLRCSIVSSLAKGS